MLKQTLILTLILFLFCCSNELTTIKTPTETPTFVHPVDENGHFIDTINLTINKDIYTMRGQTDDNKYSLATFNNDGTFEYKIMSSSTSNIVDGVKINEVITYRIYRGEYSFDANTNYLQRLVSEQEILKSDSPSDSIISKYDKAYAYSNPVMIFEKDILDPFMMFENDSPFNFFEVYSKQTDGSWKNSSILFSNSNLENIFPFRFNSSLTIKDDSYILCKEFTDSSNANVFYRYIVEFSVQSPTDSNPAFHTLESELGEAKLYKTTYITSTCQGLNSEGILIDTPDNSTNTNISGELAIIQSNNILFLWKLNFSSIVDNSENRY